MRCGVGIGVALGLALLAPAARAADKAAIQAAVDRGAAYLKGLQGPDGNWHYSNPDRQPGATALCGLALLEAGVPANDPAVQKAAQAVRQGTVANTQTYVLSLAIMFLDRLGDPADAELIDSMAVRLLAGQTTGQGTWNYECPRLADAEVRRLQDSLQKRSELVARPEPARAPEARPTLRDLPPEIQQQLQQVGRQGPTAALAAAGDNSNTQFAILALWIARRKGIPVEAALQRIDTYFRATQRPDGGWSYTSMPNMPGMAPPPAPPGNMMPGNGSTPAMTCAGLLGLALGHGSATEATLHTMPAGAAPARRQPPDVRKDPVIRNGLLFLGKNIGKPPEPAEQRPGPAGLPANLPAPPAGRGIGRVYYFLFSLERVAVAYGLDTIGDKDWYDWGAESLLHSQNSDGSWTGEFSEAGSDTCFALLFLQRANLAKDLSATLKGQVKDPARRELRAVDVENAGGGGPPKEARPAPADPEVGRLSDELVQAEPGRQDEALRKLRDGKGAAYTDALAHAIHRLDGDARNKARDALADRLARMKASTLADKLQDDDDEVRRAAALACAMKDERAHVPRLIELLADPEPTVARAARAALKSLAGQDLGPDAAAWKDWWAKNGGK